MFPLVNRLREFVEVLELLLAVDPLEAIVDFGNRSCGQWTRRLMPRKVRELLQELKAAGFDEIPGGKGSHRKLTHPRYRGAVTLSGRLGDDAKPYQEKQIRRAIEEVQN